MPAEPPQGLHFGEKWCLCGPLCEEGAIRFPLILGQPSLAAACDAQLVFHLSVCPTGSCPEPEKTPDREGTRALFPPTSTQRAGTHQAGISEYLIEILA